MGIKKPDSKIPYKTHGVIGEFCRGVFPDKPAKEINDHHNKTPPPEGHIL